MALSWLNGYVTGKEYSVIAGIGTDTVAIDAFAQQLDLPGSRFRNVFTAREMRYAIRRAQRHTRTEAAGAFATPAAEEAGFETVIPAAELAPHLAARWAAKEAFIKAWSAALYGSQPVLPEGHWDAIEVTNDRWGRPAIILGAPIAGAVHKTLGSVNIHVSMSHDGNVASAVVLIEYQNNSGARRAAGTH